MKTMKSKSVLRKWQILVLICSPALCLGQFDEFRSDSTIISSKLRIKNHGEATGRILTSDGQGNASWQNIPTGNWQTIGSNSARGGFNNNITDGTSNTILIGEAKCGEY